MYQREPETGAGFAVGVLTGALVGAGVALLLAPKAGADLREEIGESVDSLREAVGRRIRHLADRAGVTLENLHATVDKATEAVESTARELVQAAAQQVRTDGRPRG